MRRVLPLAILGWGAAAALAADDAGVRHEADAILARERIELADLFRLADLTSPVVAAARAEVDAAAGRARQGGAWANPSLSFEIEEASLEDFAYRKEKIAVVQPLPWGGRPGPASAALRAEHDVSRRSLDGARREVRAQAHALVVEILDARARGRVLGELVEEAWRTHEIARTRFESKAAPEAHATRALLERYDLELARDRAEAEGAAAAARLAALVGADVPADRLAPPPPLPDAQASRAQGMLASHPEIAAARLGTEAAAARERAATARRLPDLALHGGLGRHVALDEGFFEAGVDVDLPLFDRGGGRVDAARADVRLAEQHARRIERELAARLGAVERRRSLAAAQLAVHRESVEPAAARGLEQARAGYRAGRLSFLELIDAQQTLARARTRTLDLAREHDLAAAELAALAGLGPYEEEPGGD